MQRHKRLIRPVSAIWSSTGFGRQDITDYAERVMAVETRHGVVALSLVALLLLSGATVLYALFELETDYIYTYAALAGLSLHIFISAKAVREIKALYLLGMTLLIISGVALVLLAHQAGTFNSALFASVGLLFMVVPMVPWGLREAAIVTSLIYLIFSASTLLTANRFSSQALWALQFFMLSAAIISLSLVIRAVIVRKHDIKTRFELESAHREMELLSQQDSLTGVWNRRYLEANFDAITHRFRMAGRDCYFAVLDIDKFKTINDSCGHGYGDMILQSVCWGCKQILKANELLVRLGGDEFALILDDDRIWERLEEAIDAARTYASSHGSKNDSTLTLSFGLTRIPSTLAIALSESYKCADEALYIVKRSGGNKLLEHSQYRRKDSVVDAR